MDSDLKCNRLTCRRHLTDKAVVVRLSALRSKRISSRFADNLLSYLLRQAFECTEEIPAHGSQVECANELFNASRLCPACETALTEPDDVVVCSLHPSNDYKTSVLSGLSPSIILEICSRAISFWQYQSHQETFVPQSRLSLLTPRSSFQQAVVRNVNDKNAQLQKQLENVVREANGEINLLNNKNAELMRDVELERRKVHDLQEAARERDKEYQKLKAQLDKIKRKALLAPQNASVSPRDEQQQQQSAKTKLFSSNSHDGSGGFDSTIRNTPLVTRNTYNNSNQQQQHQQPVRRTQSHRQPFAAPTGGGGGDRSFHSRNNSTSSNEVENMLFSGAGARPAANHGWSTAPTPRRNANAPQVFAPTLHQQQRKPGGFRPAGPPRS
ncbi:hypothetical protein MKEN_00257800 [Mycena kentingensis (nom. inval.)]|nr:hypothetical protein MKEN_00257800 [Mycena kentingensis (nom. inval.)]